MATSSPVRALGPTEAAETESAQFGQRDSASHLAWLAEASRAKASDPYNYVLLLRFTLANLLGFAMVAIAVQQGMIDMVLAADRTNISVLIAVVFIGGLGLCSWKMLKISRELNKVRSFNPLEKSKAAEYLAKLRGCPMGNRGVLAGALRLKLSQSISPVRQTANSLVLLGLIGTVIGFIIALSGVDPESASDVSAVGPMISTLISGMSTALYTTLVGSILNVWLMVNYQILAGGMVKLITAIHEFGEQHARA